MHCFGVLLEPLKYMFEISIRSIVFPNNLKIARINRLLKCGDPKNFSNYRPIFVLPCFSKILERITMKKVLYTKEIWFAGWTVNRACSS